MGHVSRCQSGAWWSHLLICCWHLNLNFCLRRRTLKWTVSSILLSTGVWQYSMLLSNYSNQLKLVRFNQKYGIICPSQCGSEIMPLWSHLLPYRVLCRSTWIFFTTLAVLLISKLWVSDAHSLLIIQVDGGVNKRQPELTHIHGADGHQLCNWNF